MSSQILCTEKLCFNAYLHSEPTVYNEFERCTGQLIFSKLIVQLKFVFLIQLKSIFLPFFTNQRNYMTEAFGVLYMTDYHLSTNSQKNQLTNSSRLNSGRSAWYRCQIFNPFFRRKWYMLIPEIFRSQYTKNCNS